VSVREGVHYRGFIIDISYTYTTVTHKEAVACWWREEVSVREGVHYRGFIIDIMYVYTTVTYKEAVAWGWK
jgi:hypothetical protein